MRESIPSPNRSADTLTCDIAGFIGVVLAVVAMSDLRLTPRLMLLLASSACMPVSFFGRTDWPIWVRWWLSFAVNAFLAVAAWSFVRDAGFPIH